MFKLQPDSKKELMRIGAGVLVLAAAEVVVFAVLGLAGVVHFSYTVPLAALAGSAVTVFNFYLLCITMQQAVAVNTDPKAVRGIVQLSYNGRMLLMALWCVAAWAAPCFQFVAGALPLLFPRLVILYLQKTGKYPQGDPLPPGTEPPAETPDDPDDKEGA